MYQHVKSRVKYNNRLSKTFMCQTGDGQCDCVSPFLFVICVSDTEEEFTIKGANGIAVGVLKIMFTSLCG